ncbi:MAG TPA: hypothetical protein VMD74_01815 [Candidatus Methylomirabilis sp.]|nr:hypothetical protein [Candidatus Methylomirabilis sp.]
MNNFKKYLKLAINKLIERLILVISILMLANLIFFPHSALADTGNNANNSNSFDYSYNLAEDNQVNSWLKVLDFGQFLDKQVEVKDSHLPENNGLDVQYSRNIVLTAYNSEIGQTDDNPCITANGFNVCKNAKEDTIAVNGMKFGTRVRFPDLYGEKVFVVRDRMNSRYDSSRADIWMISKADAKKFGVKLARMEVLE